MKRVAKSTGVVFRNVGYSDIERRIERFVSSIAKKLPEDVRLGEVVVGDYDQNPSMELAEYIINHVYKKKWDLLSNRLKADMQQLSVPDAKSKEDFLKTAKSIFDAKFGAALRDVMVDWIVEKRKQDKNVNVLLDNLEDVRDFYDGSFSDTARSLANDWVHNGMKEVADVSFPAISDFENVEELLYSQKKVSIEGIDDPRLLEYIDDFEKIKEPLEQSYVYIRGVNVTNILTRTCSLFLGNVGSFGYSNSLVKFLGSELNNMLKYLTPDYKPEKVLSTLQRIAKKFNGVIPVRNVDAMFLDVLSNVQSSLEAYGNSFPVSHVSGIRSSEVLDNGRNETIEKRNRNKDDEAKKEKKLACTIAYNYAQAADSFLKMKGCLLFNSDAKKPEQLSQIVGKMSSSLFAHSISLDKNLSGGSLESAARMMFAVNDMCDLDNTFDDAYDEKIEMPVSIRNFCQELHVYSDTFLDSLNVHAKEVYYCSVEIHELFKKMHSLKSLPLQIDELDNIADSILFYVQKIESCSLASVFKLPEIVSEDLEEMSVDRMVSVSALNVAVGRLKGAVSKLAHDVGVAKSVVNRVKIFGRVARGENLMFTPDPAFDNHVSLNKKWLTSRLGTVDNDAFGKNVLLDFFSSGINFISSLPEGDKFRDDALKMCKHIVELIKRLPLAKDDKELLDMSRDLFNKVRSFHYDTLSLLRAEFLKINNADGSLFFRSMNVAISNFLKNSRPVLFSLKNIGGEDIFVKRRTQDRAVLMPVLQSISKDFLFARDGVFNALTSGFESDGRDVKNVPALVDMVDSEVSRIGMRLRERGDIFLSELIRSDPDVLESVKNLDVDIGALLHEYEEHRNKPLLSADDVLVASDVANSKIMAGVDLSAFLAKNKKELVNFREEVVKALGPYKDNPVYFKVISALDEIPTDVQIATKSLSLYVPLFLMKVFSNHIGFAVGTISNIGEIISFVNILTGSLAEGYGNIKGLADYVLGVLDGNSATNVFAGLDVSSLQVAHDAVDGDVVEQAFSSALVSDMPHVSENDVGLDGGDILTFLKPLISLVGTEQLVSTFGNVIIAYISYRFRKKVFENMAELKRANFKIGAITRDVSRNANMLRVGQVRKHPSLRDFKRPKDLSDTMSEGEVLSSIGEVSKLFNESGFLQFRKECDDKLGSYGMNLLDWGLATRSNVSDAKYLMGRAGVVQNEPNFLRRAFSKILPIKKFTYKSTKKIANLHDQKYDPEIARDDVIGNSVDDIKNFNEQIVELSRINADLLSLQRAVVAINAAIIERNIISLNMKNGDAMIALYPENGLLEGMEGVDLLGLVPSEADLRKELFHEEQCLVQIDSIIRSELESILRIIPVQDLDTFSSVLLSKDLIDSVEDGIRSLKDSFVDKFLEFKQVEEELLKGGVRIKQKKEKINSPAPILGSVNEPSYYHRRSMPIKKNGRVLPNHSWVAVSSSGGLKEVRVHHPLTNMGVVPQRVGLSFRKVKDAERENRKQLAKLKLQRAKDARRFAGTAGFQSY